MQKNCTPSGNFSTEDWIKQQAQALGFSACGISAPVIAPEHGEYLAQYLQKGYHGDMHFLAEHTGLRNHPEMLFPGIKSIISVRMDYLVAAPPSRHVPDCPDQGIIARYARGRDYHKTVRQRLKQLGQQIQQAFPQAQTRPFADSAPIFEKALASQAGLGWTGKNALLVHPQAGSFFLLGELFTTLELEPDPAFEQQHCGSCTACLDICPTRAFTGPYQLDAQKCIAYLTIEYRGVIAEELRPGIGNRIFGCDDCQLVCPWNKFARRACVTDFNPRHQLDDTSLHTFWQWSEAGFLARTEGSPLRRTGYEAFMRNVAIGLGNSTPSLHTIQLLADRLDQLGPLVREHAEWAIRQQQKRLDSQKLSLVQV